jgi:hypothetical protein
LHSRDPTGGLRSPARQPETAKPFAQVAIEAINGLATRTAANYRDEKAALIDHMRSCIRDPDTHPSTFGLAAEAVLDGRMDREDLYNLIRWCLRKEQAGEIRKSIGALFRNRLESRLGPDLKGGAK